MNIKKEFNEELKKIKADTTSDYNIFVSHGAVAGIKVFTMNEFNELMIPVKILSQEILIILLLVITIHIQNLQIMHFIQVQQNDFTFTDANDKKGFIELEF